MTASDLLTAAAVFLACAFLAFAIVASWVYLGGLVTYLIALLVGGACIHTWSGNDEQV
jgi:predicted membrane chloride channel (bestrophin family)